MSMLKDLTVKASILQLNLTLLSKQQKASKQGVERETQGTTCPDNVLSHNQRNKDTCGIHMCQISKLDQSFVYC